MAAEPGAAVASDDPAVHYDRVALAWKRLLGEDFHYGYFRDPSESLAEATQNLTLLMAERAAIAPGVAVLDVGCGTGNAACFLADRFGCRVTGIATSPAVIEQARARAAQRGLAGRVDFELGDGMDNGRPDASFDRVWVLESSHLMPRKDRLLAESARALRPGGRLALCDIVLRREIDLPEVMRRAKDFHLLRLAFGRAKMETLATYRALAEQAGLVVESLDDVSEQAAPTFQGWRRNLDRHHAEIERLIGADGAAHFAASCEILPRLFAERILGYGIVAARKP